jgi:hypothetical protein
VAKGNEIALLLDALDEAFERKSWHGTNLKGSVRGMGVEAALWRPGPGRHNAWELAVHAAYWKYVVRRMLTGEPKGGFPLEGSNFFPRPSGSAAEWTADLRLLSAEHRRLRAAVAALRPSDLGRKPAGSRNTVVFLVRGATAHDLYHAGQIQLLKRLRAG